MAFRPRGFGVAPPRPPSFGSVVSLVPPSFILRGGHPAVVPSVALPPLLLHAGAWLLIPAHPLSQAGTPIPGWGLRQGSFWVGFTENLKEKHQLTALRGAETWGLIGSILGEFFWRAVCPPLPERWGFRVSPVVSASPASPAFCHLCFGVNPSRTRTIWAGRDVGSLRMEVGWCWVLLPTPVTLGWVFFAEGHSLSLGKSCCSRQTLLACGGKPVLTGGRGAVALCFLGKLKPGGGQSWVLPSPGHGRWWGHGYASVTVPCLSHGGEGMLGFGGHTQGTSARLALACRAVLGRRWLSCARRLAWGIRDL